MKIIELFDSLQGEGPLAGHPAKFVRFAGCNLRCVWCDTKFAQDADERELISEDALTNALKAHDHTVPLVFTGGEPLLQQDYFPRLFRYLDERQDVWFETNGTIKPSDALLSRRHESLTQFVVSPKPDHVQLDTLERLLGLGSFFKFVVGAEAWHVRELLALIKTLDIDREYVWMMPEGATRAEQLENMPWTWEFCVKHGFNFSARLHTLTFDKRRGV